MGAVRQRLIFPLVAVLLGLLVVVLAGEATARVLGVGMEPFDNADPVLGHRYKRSMEMDVREMGRSIHYRTNSLGFRGPEVRAQKDRPRVLFLGDSFTAGQDWQEDGTFVRLLEQRLGVEAINLGVPAYDTGVELVALQRIGLGLQPDAVVLGIFVGNDVRENSREMSPLPRPTFSLDGNGALVEHGFTPRGARPGQWLLENSALYTWQKHAVRRATFRLRAAAQGGDPMHAVFGSRPDAQWQDAWKVTGALLGQFKRVLETAHIPLLVVLIPDVVQVDDTAWKSMVDTSPALAPLDRTFPQRQLNGMLLQLGITSVDLLPALQAAPPVMGGSDPLYDGHFAARGHATVANTLEPVLRSMLPALP